ncbi:hypothetical protein ACQPUZ_19245, partial [Clostridium tertium]
NQAIQTLYIFVNLLDRLINNLNLLDFQDLTTKFDEVTTIKITDILIRIVAIAVAISVHEFGHAYSAHLLGDDTAKMYGRMTLDPAKHIDPLGILMMLIFRIGWAKPVPVNSSNFKNYKVGNVIVSLAGAIGNILAAIVCVIIMKHVNMEAVRDIASVTMMYNISFAAFNLLPIPPLDGWGVISPFIPY